MSEALSAAALWAWVDAQPDRAPPDPDPEPEPEEQP